MKMKFQSTTLQPKALLYRRFTSIEHSNNLETLYETQTEQNGTTTPTYWLFDYETQNFIKLDSESAPKIAKIVPISDFYTVLQYRSAYYRFNGVEWQKTGNTSSDKITLLSASFNNVGKYQTNKYYYVGSFDYMLKGSISGTETQFVKGNIIPLRSLNIKFFDDDLRVTEDDLVVVDGHLYSVENPEDDIKHQPYQYTIHFATLNSIL